MRQGTKQQFARTLRANPTEAERVLWYNIRRKQLYGFRFRRQHPIGPYVVDFACLEANLVVEVDGSQHLDSRSDAHRDEWLASHGLRIVRVWNHDVLARIDGVLEGIVLALRQPRPHPASGHLPPQAGEGKIGASVRDSRDGLERT